MLLALALASSAVAARAAPAPQATRVAASEYQVKAAFLYHFARLAEWPAPPPSFEVGVVGHDAFDPVLQEVIAGKIVHDHAIRVRHYDGIEAVRRSPPQMLFIAGPDMRAAREVLQAVDGAPVLTVSDLDGFAEQGGMIGFRLTPDGRVGFDINLSRVQKAGLRLSSQVLKLARIVEAP